MREPRMPEEQLPESHQDVEGEGHKVPVTWHTPSDVWHYRSAGPTLLSFLPN